MRSNNFGMRWIVSAVAIVLTAVAVISVGLFQERATRQVLTEELEARLLLEARNLSLASSSALLNEFPELTLHPLLKEKQARNPEFSLLVVLDHENRIQGHPDFRRLGETYSIDEGFLPRASSQELDADEELLGSDRLVVIRAPVAYQDQRIGTVAVGIEKDYIEQILREARLRLLAILGAALVLSVLVSFFTMTGLLAPIDDLRRGLHKIGQGDLDHKVAVRGRTELGMLADTVNSMASELKLAQADMVEKERLSRELELAREIQSRLLPHSERTSGAWVVAGSHRAAFEVGGDYYDYFALEGGRTGVVIADVAGKGLGGCLVMSMLAVLLKAYRNNYDSPKELIGKLDEALSPDLKLGSFITLFYGILDEATGQFRFASAGHMPTLVRRANSGTVEEYRTRGIPVGAIRGGAVAKSLHDEVVVLEPGDLLLQYTDGINESHDAAENEFDIDGVTSLLKEHPESNAAETLSLMDRALESWRGGKVREDDETLIVLTRQATGAETAPQSVSQPEEASQPRILPFPAIRANPEATAPIRRLDDAGATAWLDLASRTGHRLALSTQVEPIDVVAPWLPELGEFQTLSPRHLELLETALHEVCCNISEHGYSYRAAEFELWWVPNHNDVDSGALGHFVLHDHGRSFSPENWTASDFRDPKVRRQTRGFGLDIINTVMSAVGYQSSETRGNITVLTFDPDEVSLKEVNHA